MFIVTFSKLTIIAIKSSVIPGSVSSFYAIGLISFAVLSVACIVSIERSLDISASNSMRSVKNCRLSLIPVGLLEHRLDIAISILVF